MVTASAVGLGDKGLQVGHSLPQLVFFLLQVVNGRLVIGVLLQHGMMVGGLSHWPCYNLCDCTPW